MRTKICTDKNCGFQNKPQSLENFNKDKSKSDGYSWRCKKCHKLYLDQYKNKQMIYNNVELKTCCDPQCINPGPKSISNFYKQKTNKSGYRARCKECINRERKEKRPECLERERKYLKSRPGYNSAKTGRYRARLLQATPKWANKEKIESIYEEAARLTKETGVEYTVDHIVPLKNDKVCGLHVEYNLQILTKSENSSKRNKF